MTLPDLPNFLCQIVQVPLGLPSKVLDYMEEELDKTCKLEDLKAGGNLDYAVRDCRGAALYPDQWVAAMLSNVVREINEKFFRYDLTHWADYIQYTVYDTQGSHYKWHCDAKNSYNQGTSEKVTNIRKLSISVVLSDPNSYEGGELQFHNINSLHSCKPERGTAIIFPSTTPHRVRPLKSGVRKSIVGWMGGPPWK